MAAGRCAPKIQAKRPIFRQKRYQNQRYEGVVGVIWQLAATTLIGASFAESCSLEKY
jgi:hypothetical protein